MKRFSALALAAALVAGMSVFNMMCSQQRLTDERLQEMKEAKQSVAQAQEERETAPAESPEAKEEAAPAAQEAPAAAPAEWPETAPDTFLVCFDTSKGDIVVECTKAWAPIGAQHFYDLVRAGFYDGVKFFRVVNQPRPFVVQFGIAATPEVQRKLGEKTIKDEPPRQSNTRGMLVYAKSSLPNSRSTQLFINLGNNSNLDSMGFAPFGKVVKGMDVVEKLNGQYQEAPSRMQQAIKEKGNAYLDEQFPGLDYIGKAALVPSNSAQ